MSHSPRISAPSDPSRLADAALNDTRVTGAVGNADFARHPKGVTLLDQNKGPPETE